MRQTTLKALVIAAFLIYSGCGQSGFHSLDVTSLSPLHQHQVKISKAL